MNESQRAVAHVPGVRMHCTGYGAVREASVSSCVLLCCFVAGALRGLTRKDGSLPTLTYAVALQGGRSGRWRT